MEDISNNSSDESKESFSSDDNKNPTPLRIQSINHSMIDKAVSSNISIRDDENFIKKNSDFIESIISQLPKKKSN